MAPIRSLTFSVLLLACTRSASIQRTTSAVDTAPSARAEASPDAFPRVVMGFTRVCVVTSEAVRCGSRVSGEAETVWRDETDAVSSVALGYRACRVRKGRAACVGGGSQDSALQSLPVEAPVSDLVIDGVHARVCTRSESRVACVDDNDHAAPVFDGATSLFAGHGALWGTDGARHLWCEGEGLCARLRAAGPLRFDDEGAGEGWIGRRDARVAAGRVEGVGALDELAVDEGMLCARDEGGRVWCVGELFAPVEVRSMRGARGLVLVGARVCVREGDALRCVLPGDERAQTIALDGAVALATQGDGLCVVDGRGAVRCARVAGTAPVTWRAVALSP